MSVGHHCVCDIRSAHKNYHPLRSGYSGIEQISCKQHMGRAVERYYYYGVLASLAFMHSDGICVLKLLKHRKIIGYVAVVKDYLHTLVQIINSHDITYIAVEYSHTRAVILASPINLIVVFDLHYLVTLTEDALSVLVLSLSAVGRIERSL